MSLSQEAQEWNDAQKRYRENAHLHKHTTGADHSEMMAVLFKIELGLGVLIDTIKEWVEDEEKRREDERRRATYGYSYGSPRTQRSDSQQEYPTYQPNPRSARRSGGDRNEPNSEFGDGVVDGRGGS
jgi:hypothetical protein